jgi:hypothetical protein
MNASNLHTSRASCERSNSPGVHAAGDLLGLGDDRVYKIDLFGR